jgi:Nucleotidyltransferase of unknown function (DUF6036)
MGSLTPRTPKWLIQGRSFCRQSNGRLWANQIGCGFDILEIDRTYTSTIGPLHEDFPDRAKVLEASAGSPLVVLLPSREDLALSKLDRLSEADIDDILVLMGSSDASWDLLESLTQDVGKYPLV